MSQPPSSALGVDLRPVCFPGRRFFGYTCPPVRAFPPTVLTSNSSLPVFSCVTTFAPSPMLTAYAQNREKQSC